MVAAPVEFSHARATLAAAAARSADLVASLPDHQVRLARSEWTIGDAAAHLAIALQGFADAATSDGAVAAWRALIPSAAGYPERLAGLNQATIDAAPRLGPEAAGRAITDAARAFLDATSALAPSHTIPTPWYGEGVTHTALSATCLLVGEQLIHGYDIARAGRRTWPISSGEANVVFEGVRTMMPLVANPATSRDLSATYQLHVGRSSRFVVRVADGTATVDPPGQVRIDCHIAGTPRALLLVGYGRISQWHAIATGRLIAWGRKPWLGFRFVTLFFNP